MASADLIHHISKSSHCLLCDHLASQFYLDVKGQSYYLCPQCDLRFLDPKRHLSSAQEVARYETHQNFVEDASYQQFMSPMVNLILSSVPPGSEVLDFGCGRAPMLEHLLGPKGYKVRGFDPFFNPDESALHKTYDFIAGVEVFEHLYSPSKEIEMLRSMLKPSGHLGVMTCLVTNEIDFEIWWYRNDPTHVVFYSKKSFDWIAKHHMFGNHEFLGDRLTHLWL